MDEATLDVSPFCELKVVDLSTRNHYCTRQLNVILSTNAILKGEFKDGSLIITSLLVYKTTNE